MAQIDPNTVQWDAPPQPVGKPVTGSATEPLKGGVILPGKPEKPEKPDYPSGYEPDPNKPGRLRAIPGGPADKPSKMLPEGSAQKLTDDVDQVDAISRALNSFNDNYAGSPFASVESLLQGLSAEFGTPGQRNWWADFKASDNIIRSKLFGASLTPAEQASYESTTITPSLDPQTIKENLQKRLQIVQKATQRRYNRLKAAGYNPEEIDAVVGEVPIFGGATPPPSKKEEAGGPPPEVTAIKTGEAFQTEQDLAIQRQLQDAWNAGRSVDEIIQLNQQLGRGTFSPQDIQRMRDARSKGGPMSFYASPTGQPTAMQEALGGFLQTAPGEAIGGYAVGAANALTAGLLDELAPVIGLDANQVQAAKDYLRAKAPVSSFIGEAAGGVAAALPFVSGVRALTAGTRLAPEAAALLGETAYGATYGAGEAPEGERALGALIGGGAAGVTGALANRFLPGGPGTFTGAAPQEAPTPRFAGPEASPAQIVEAGQQANIPVMTSDVRPPETFMGKMSQQVGEIVPLGTSGMRRGQQESREQAVENILADAGVTIDRDIAGDLVKNLTQKRSADLTKFSDMKREVIERLATAGDVPATKSLDAIDNLIGKLEAENLPRQLGPLIQQLQDAKASLSGPGDLSKIEANRATLFDLKSDPSLGNIASKTEKAWDAVYKALNDDMGEFIKANGDIKDFNRWKVANTKLAMMAGELRQGGLKRVLDKGDFNPETVTKMLTSTTPQEARLLFTNLGKEGRANARLLLLQTAAKRALDPNTGIINPSTFAREIGKLKNNFDQFFGGPEAKRVNGLVAVLNATRRAQEAEFAPRTGERLVPFATAGSFGWLGTLLGLEPTTGIASSAAFGAARRIYESAPARDLLLKIGKSSGSEKAKLISDFTQRISAAAAPVAAERMVGPEAGPPEGAIIVGPQQ